MEEFVLKRRREIISTLISFLIIGLAVVPFYNLRAQEPLEVEHDPVIVTASVEAWLNFIIDETNLTLDQSLVDAAGDTHIGTAVTAIDIGTNNTNGWFIQIKGLHGGLYNDDADHTIDTVSESDTLTAGVDGYGATIEDIFVGEGLTIPADYLEDTDFAGEIPGDEGDAIEIASFGGPHDEQEVANFRVRAAAAQATPSGDYTDTITLTAVAPLD